MSALTLLLRLAGPMQSWGTQSHFTRRDTGLEPSKSGVIGLLCAALGRPREAPVDDLVALQMGVRVDHEGTLQVDFQTAGGSPRGRGVAGTAGASGGRGAYGVAEFSGGVRTVISRRAYLADASFLVGLEAASPEQEQLLRTLDAALAHPFWPLFLGRKSYVPAEPVRLPDSPPLGPGLTSLPLRAALLGYPWPASAPAAEGASNGQGNTAALRFVLEDPTALGGESRQDVPISFSPLDRRYAPRFVRTEFHARPEAAPIRSEQ